MWKENKKAVDEKVKAYEVDIFVRKVKFSLLRTY